MRDKSVSRYEYLTETPVPRLITTLAVPTIISMLVTGLYNMADTYFVGKISTEATSAVGVAFSAMAIIQAFGFFCGHGSGNYISRMLGANRREEANYMASTGFAAALVIGIVLALAGLLFSRPVALLTGARPTSVDEAASYLRIIMMGAPFMTCQFVINNQLRFQGSAFSAMIGLMCGAVMNIGLDPLFIFVFDLGVEGAALATITGQLTSFIVLLIAGTRGENVKLAPANVKFNGVFFKEIINGGAPSLFRQGLAAVATILLNVFAGAYGGDAAIAGMSIVTRIMMLLSAAVIGFGQGYQPVCSFNYGARLTDRVKEGYFFSVKVTTVFLLFGTLACMLFAPEMVGFFRDDADVIAVGEVALRWQAIALPLMGVIIMTNMMLQSTGHGLKASVASSLRNGIIFVPLILILAGSFGLFGVQIAQAVTDFISVTISVPLAMSELKKM